MKRIFTAFTVIIMFFILATNVWAEDIKPTFLSIEYLSAHTAATKISEMTQVTYENALESIKKAQSNIPLKATGLLPARATPAYVYAHVDIGNETYLELGAIVIVTNNSGKLQITDTVASYCRPVNRSVAWTPSGELTIEIEKNSQLRFSIAGEAFVEISPASAVDLEKLTAQFTSFGFSPKRDALGFTKQITVTTSCDLKAANTLTEKDVANGYIAMLTHFQDNTNTSIKGYSKVAIDLKAPVGLTEASQKLFFNHITQASGGKLLETDSETYATSWDKTNQLNSLADCLLKIESVTIVQNTMYFKISGIMGAGKYYVLASNEIQKNADISWKIVNPDKITIKIS